MGIEKRDRSMKDMFENVQIKAIPMKYVDQVVVGIDSGDDIIYGSKDVKDLESIEELLSELPDDIIVTDVGVRLSYHRMETDIKEHVSNLVEKYNGKK